MTTLEKRETNWLPWALMLATALLVFGYLYFGFGYATGYMETRATLWSDMRQGYTKDAGEWAFEYFVPPSVLLLLWVTRERVVGITPKSSWLGLAVIAFACFVYFGGYKANEKYVGYASGQLMVAGFLDLIGEDVARDGTRVMSAPTEEMSAGERFNRSQ